MKAEIIAVGTELLMGQTINTNATYLSQELAKLSIPIYHQQVVGDNEERILEALNQAVERSQLIILSGGLGPTTDDLTKQVVAKFTKKRLIENAEAMEKIIHYHQQSHCTMSKNNHRQALAFEGGHVFKNHVGLAIGGAVEYQNCLFIVLPGPPTELQIMMKKEVVPFLERYYQLSQKFISRYLRFFGIGESRLVTDLEDLIASQSNPTIAPYASDYEVVLRLTANGASELECQQLLDKLEASIMEKAQKYFYGYGEEESLLHLTSRLLKDSQLTIACAESLTGGLFTSELVSVDGSSQYVKGGTIVYQKEQKIKQLHIDPELLKKFGTVSRECAEAMAIQIRQLYDSDLGISFTGIAGPNSIEEKEVGTVFIALADKQCTEIYELHLSRDRNGNRYFTVQHGLNIIRSYLLRKNKRTNVRYSCKSN